MSWGSPPAETGQRLAAFPRKGARGEETELRVSIDEYEGHRYIGLRVWRRDFHGQWWPTQKGLSVRRAELAGVIEALQEGHADLGEPEPQPRQAARNDRAERQQQFIRQAKESNAGGFSRDFDEFEG